jgi:hypothetical protein
MAREEKMPGYPKAVRRKLEELAVQAYERDLNKEIAKLADRFDEWRAGQLDPWELTDLIHKFHNGPARELYKVYNSDFRDLAVASAVARDILSQEEVPEKVWPYLQNEVEIIKRRADEVDSGDAQEPEA